MRRVLYVAGLGLAFLAGGVTLKRADAAPPPAAVVSSAGGRFQVVNGTPDQARNIMLLDSTTGDTWVACADAETRGWCRLLRSNATASAPDKP
jgi:hypothetical protein